MFRGRRLSLAILVGMLPSVVLLSPIESKALPSEYRQILERRPFGKTPPKPKPVPAAPVPLEKSFARNLRLGGLLDLGHSVFASISDEQNKAWMYLAVGEEDEDSGITLAGVDYEAQRVLLCQDGVEQWLGLKDAPSPSENAGKASGAAFSGPARRLSRKEMLKARRNRTKAALQKHRAAGRKQGQDVDA